MQRVAFLHPDLGIGGAERLIVDAAVALQVRGHECRIYTSHHDPKHAFDETVSLKGSPVVLVAGVYGDWLPRNIFGGMAAFCAWMRQVWLTVVLVIWIWPFDKTWKPTVCVVDQVPVAVPILRLFGYRIMFYCHFPDQLLAPRRQSFFAKLYGSIMARLEWFCIRYAHVIRVNSRFTRRVYANLWLQESEIPPRVLYPALNVPSQRQFMTQILQNSSLKKLYEKYLKAKFMFVSVNRFEGKKNIPLCVDAFANWKSRNSDGALVLIGGYHRRVLDNYNTLTKVIHVASGLGLSVHCHWRESPTDEELQNMKYASHSFATDSNLVCIPKADILCLPSADNAVRTLFVSLSRALLYTPRGEHFGIVPLEAMALGCPCIAVDDAGPRETIVHRKTGYLVEDTTNAFGQAMQDLLDDSSWLIMKEAAIRHVSMKFGQRRFGAQWERALLQAVKGVQPDNLHSEDSFSSGEE